MKYNPETIKPKTIIEIVIEYTQIILEKKLFIIIFSGIITALVAAFLIVSALLPSDISPLPNMYKASASLFLIESQDTSYSTMQSAFGRDDTNQTPGESPYARMAMQVLATRSFADKIIDEFNFKEKYRLKGSIEDTRLRLRALMIGKSSFDYNRNGQLLHIYYSDIDPVFAKNVVNSMVDRLNEWFSTKGGTIRSQQKRIFQEKLVEVTQDIAELESKLKELQKKYDTLSIEDSAESEMRIIADLQSQLILKELEIKNYANISRIEDRKSMTLKSERQNILTLIDQVKEGTVENSIKMPPLSQLPEIAQEFAHLNTNLQIQRRIYETLAQQYEIIKLAQGSEPIFEVLEYAEVPYEKFGPQRVLILIGGIVVGILLSIAIVLGRHFLTPIISRYMQKNK
jgi:uncharacterized protein involved in exopolysaccharide biosynthesis